LTAFVGRGERRVQRILESLFHGKAFVIPQMPIEKIIKPEEFAILGKEHNRHKFDLVVKFVTVFNRSDIVVEVNYSHGNGAAKKWLNVYMPAVKSAGKIPVTIDDHACKSIFDTKEERPLRWMDYIDVINALDVAGVKP
jgi:hypothetical protein